MIRCITFDLDDTLWDVRPALLRAEQAQNTWLNDHYPQALKDTSDSEILALKKAVLEDEPSLRHNISLFRQRFIQRLLTDAGVDASEARQASEDAFAAFIARRNDVELYPFSDSVLGQLGKSYRLGALTNGNADVFKTPIGRHFEFALQAEQVGAAKPAPALFDRAREVTNLAHHEMLHVGDSHDHDVVGALGAGIDCIWLAGDGATSDIATGIISCLSELPEVLTTLQSRVSPAS